MYAFTFHICRLQMLQIQKRFWYINFEQRKGSYYKYFYKIINDSELVLLNSGIGKFLNCFYYKNLTISIFKVFIKKFPWKTMHLNTLHWIYRLFSGTKSGQCLWFSTHDLCLNPNTVSLPFCQSNRIGKFIKIISQNPSNLVHDTSIMQR